MDIKNELRFRELQVMFFLGMSEYPNDKERMEQGMQLLIKFIDSYAAAECSKILTETSTLRQGGVVKGGKFNA
jgi:hypothetical protein